MMLLVVPTVVPLLPLWVSIAALPGQLFRLLHALWPMNIYRAIRPSWCWWWQRRRFYIPAAQFARYDPLGHEALSEESPFSDPPSRWVASPKPVLIPPEVSSPGRNVESVLHPSVQPPAGPDCSLRFSSYKSSSSFSSSMATTSSSSCTATASLCPFVIRQRPRRAKSREHGIRDERFWRREGSKLTLRQRLFVGLESNRRRSAIAFWCQARTSRPIVFVVGPVFN